MNLETMVRLIRDVGFPIVLSLLLVFALLGWLPSTLSGEHAALKRQGYDVTYLLEIICLNTAVDPAARRACLSLDAKSTDR